MKKTITALALSAASSSAFALMAPHNPEEIVTKTICLNVYQDSNGVSYADSCDASSNNEFYNSPLLANGCAQGQVALTATKINHKFNVSIKSCVPVNITQL